MYLHIRGAEKKKRIISGRGKRPLWANPEFQKQNPLKHHCRCAGSSQPRESASNVFPKHQFLGLYAFFPAFGLFVCLFPGSVGGHVHQKHATYLTFLIWSLKVSSLKSVSWYHSLQWRAQSKNSQKQGNVRTAHPSPSSAQQAFRTSIRLPQSL